MSSLAKRPPRSGAGTPYLLLITPGTDKFADEERGVVDACAAKGLRTRTVYSDKDAIASGRGETLSPARVLTPGDHCWVMFKWVLELFKGLRWWVSRDGKARSLFVAAIPGIRDYWSNVAFSRRVVAAHGRPRALLSLEPWSSTSLTIVDWMKTKGVLTAGTRTQTTMDRDEHAVINTDILFAKSTWEEDLYRRVLGERGPALQRGCILSLPPAPPLEPLALPGEFVLVLGTARQYSQDDRDYRDLRDTLERVASTYDLPVVLKAHPAERLDGDRTGTRDPGRGASLLVTDVTRNRELIDRASLVVSAPSTLLYQAILSETPVVIVEADPEGSPDDEFHSSPIARISRGAPAEIHLPHWEDLRASARKARTWFEENYFLDKGAAFIIDYLVEYPDVRGS